MVFKLCLGGVESHVTHCCASRGDWRLLQPAVYVLGSVHFMFVHSSIYPTSTCQKPQGGWALGTQVWVMKADRAERTEEVSTPITPLLARPRMRLKVGK